LGAVLRSPFKNPLAQFTVSVDYFKITVADAMLAAFFSFGGGGF
jgi:hypothetical protein